MGQLAAAVIVLVTAVSQCYCITVSHPINWTREFLSQYNSSNPLSVNIGDFVVITCTQDFRIHILTDISQFNNCSCDVIPCNAENQNNIQCGLNRQATVLVSLNSAALPTVFRYVPGETYYYTTFEEGTTSGGPCLPTEDQPGLRMAVTVVDPDAVTTTPPPSPSSTSSGAITTPDGNGTPDPKTTLSPDTSKVVPPGGGTTIQTTPTTSTEALSNMAAVVGGSVAGGVIGVVLLIICLLVVILLLVIFRHRRKKGDSLKESLEGGKQETGGPAKANGKAKSAEEDTSGRRKSSQNPYTDFKYLSDQQDPNPEKENQQQQDNQDNQEEFLKVDLGSGGQHLFESSQGFEVPSGGYFYKEPKQRLPSHTSSIGETIPEERDVEVSMTQSTTADQQNQDTTKPPTPVAPPTARLVSIDEDATIGNNLTSPDDSTKAMKYNKQDSASSSITSFTALAAKRHREELENAVKNGPSSKFKEQERDSTSSSITSFTALAAKRHRDEELENAVKNGPSSKFKEQDSFLSTQSSATSLTGLLTKHTKEDVEKNTEKSIASEVVNDDVFIDTEATPLPTADPTTTTTTTTPKPPPPAEKPQPVPRKVKRTASSNSLNNILLETQEILDGSSAITTLPRGDKPKPKPRGRKSESESKKNHAYEDIDACKQPDSGTPPASTSDPNQQQ